MTSSGRWRPTEDDVSAHTQHSPASALRHSRLRHSGDSYASSLDHCAVGFQSAPSPHSCASSSATAGVSTVATSASPTPTAPITADHRDATWTAAQATTEPSDSGAAPADQSSLSSNDSSSALDAARTDDDASMFAMISTRRRSDTHLKQLPLHLLIKHQQQQEQQKLQQATAQPVGLPPPAPMRTNPDATALSCAVCLQPHLQSECPYRCPPAKEQREPIVEGSADFVPLDRWLASLVRVEIDAENAVAVHSGWQSELDGPERAASRAAFLLTLLYHSSPYDLLRRILTLLRIPPPPSPYESNPAVFSAEEEESPPATAVPTTADDAEDESSVTSPATSKRSADVRIASKDAKSPSRASIHSPDQQHASPLPPHLARPRATVVASEDDPLSCTPAVSSPSFSVASSASAASSHVPSRSTAPHSTASTETSSPHSAAALVPGASSSAPSPRSGARPLGTVSVQQVRAHIRSLSARSNTASAAPAPTPSSRIAAFQQWHSSKLHLLQLLHAWLITYPQDFCCLPHVISSTAAASSPPRRPLEELLHRELVAFPPPEWLRVLPWASGAASPVSGEIGVAVGSLRGTKTAVALTPQMVQAMKDAAAALMIEYSQARRAYMGPDEVSPNGDAENSTTVGGGGRDSPVSTASSSSASGSAGAVTSPLQFHRASPSPPPSSNFQQGGVSSSPTSTAPTVTPNKRGSGILSPSLTATAPGSAGQLGSPILAAHHNSWSQTWGNSAVQRNLESSNKLRRMMQADGGGGAGGSTAVLASLSPHLSARTSISPSLSASSAQAVQLQLATKTTSEFLAVAPRSYAAALTWLAIMRLEEIGNCAREDASGPAATAAGSSHGGTPSSTTRSLTPVQLQSPQSPPCAGSSCKVSHHHPAPLSSPAFLRLFLRMPAWLSRAQMRMSNTMSCFVASTILRAPNVPQRKAVIKHWLEIAQACLEQPLGDLTNPLMTARASTAAAASLVSQLATGPHAQYHNPNFMHAFEIIYGINHQSVYRLPAAQAGPDGKMGSGHRGSILGALTGGSSSKDPTLPLLHKRNFLSHASYEIYTRLTKLTSPNGNYRDYRRALAEAQDALPVETASPLLSHASAQGGRFYIPYLGILLKDLVGLEDAGKPLAGVAVEEDRSNGTAAEEDDESSASTSKPASNNAAPNSIPSNNSSSVLLRSASILSEASITESAAEESDDDVHPTGSLPWDDSFLARPRRNATLVLRPPFLPPPVFGAVAPTTASAPASASSTHATLSRARLAGGGGGCVLSQLEEETDEELFAAPSSSPAPPLVRQPSPAVLPGPGTMSPLSQAPRQQQVSDRSLWLDNEKRHSLLSMLTDGGSGGAGRNGEGSAGSSPGSSFAPFLPTPPMSPIHRSTKPRMSLLTASLPPRRTVSPSISAVARTSSPSTADCSPLDSTTCASSSSLLLLNYSKLTKISAIAESTLRCRAFFPVPPPDEFSAQGPPPLDLQREQQAAFGSVLTQAAITAQISDELRSSALSVASALPRRAEASAAIFSLPFDRRVQHWLVSSMLTYTLLEESQLMDKSYTLYPRKIAGNAGKAGAKLSIAE